jgi:O26-antigen biosynthesis N-acetyl-L-fucosamine transferase
MNQVIFRELFPSLSNISVLMNWSTSSTDFKKISSNDIHVRLYLVDKLIFFYGGNIGHAQDTTNIMSHD